MVVGELQMTALADIQRGTAVIHQLLAVEPRLEEAVAPGGPLHGIHEVVPDVLGDRTNRSPVEARVGRSIDYGRAARDPEFQPGGEGSDLEVRLSGRAGVVEVEDHAPVPDRPGGRNDITRREHERVRPPLILSLVAIARRCPEVHIGTLGRTAAEQIAVPWLRGQLRCGGTVAPRTRDRGATGGGRLQVETAIRGRVG